MVGWCIEMLENYYRLYINYHNSTKIKQFNQFLIWWTYYPNFTLFYTYFINHWWKEFRIQVASQSPEMKLKQSGLVSIDTYQGL